MTVEENSSRLKLGSLMRSTSSPSMRPMRSWPPKGHDENDWFQKVLASLKAFRCFLEMIPALLCGEPVLLKMHQSQCKYDLSVSQPFHSKVSMAPESWVLNDWHLQFPLSLLPGSPPMTFRLSGGNAASSRLKSSNLRHLKNGTCLQMQACKTSRL